MLVSVLASVPLTSLTNDDYYSLAEGALTRNPGDALSPPAQADGPSRHGDNILSHIIVQYSVL